MPGTPRIILAVVLVSVLAFALAFGLALRASRLRSVAGLMALVAAAYAGGAADPRGAAIAVVLPAALALVAADSARLRLRGRRLAPRRGPVPHRRHGEIAGAEVGSRQPVTAVRSSARVSAVPIRSHHSSMAAASGSSSWRTSNAIEGTPRSSA
jgi:hypothetical protein